MKERGNKGLIVITIILVVVLLAGGTFVAYDKGLIFKKKDNSSDNSEVKKDDNNENIKEDNSEDNKSNNGSVKTENLSLNDSRFINLYNILENYTYEQNRTGYQSFTAAEIAKIVGDNVEYKVSDFVKTDVANKYEYLSDEYYTINASLFENKALEIFGDNITFNKQNIVGSEVYVSVLNNYIRFEEYVASNDTYIVGLFSSGALGYPHPILDLRKIESATLENNTITVKEKAIYVEKGDDIYRYSIYGGPNKSNYIDTKVFNESNINNETISVNSYLDKASTITHVYKLNSKTGKYYFEKSVIE